MNTFKKIIYQTLLVGSIISFAFGVAYLKAWTGPTSTPPNDNVAAPINTGFNAQQKDGAFALFNNFYTQGIGVNVSPPLYSLDMGPTANGITSGIRFSDGTVQTTKGVSPVAIGYIPVSSNTFNLGSSWTTVHFSGYDNDSDKGAAGGFIWRSGATTYARLYAAIRHGEFTVDTTQRCVNLPNAPAADDVFCAQVDGSGNLLIRTGTGISLDYLIYN